MISGKAVLGWAEGREGLECVLDLIYDEREFLLFIWVVVAGTWLKAGSLSSLRSAMERGISMGGE